MTLTNHFYAFQLFRYLKVNDVLFIKHNLFLDPRFAFANQKKKCKISMIFIFLARYVLLYDKSVAVISMELHHCILKEIGMVFLIDVKLCPYHKMTRLIKKNSKA